MQTKTMKVPISENMDFLSKEKMLSALKEKNLFFIRDIHYFSETDSTNLQAKQKASEDFENFTLLIADKQTQGRGRRGRSFDSPAGSGIFLSLLLKPDISPDKASMLTLIAGLAVRKALFLHCSLDSMIKWPNDIVLNGKKICGVLTEMSADMQGIRYVIIGIGINVHNTFFPEELSEIATSVFLETQKHFSRARLTACILECFKEYYDIFLQTQDLSVLKEEYDTHMINRNAVVVIEQETEKFTGIAKRIDENGTLIIERNGQEEKILSGEVSVRGVYGYV